MAVARVTEIVAASKKGFSEAVADGLSRAAKSLRGITGIDVVRMNAKVENNKIVEYRVHLNVTFILED